MDPARVMLAAAAASGAAVWLLAWRTARIDPSHPTRLVGELHVARWAAVLLAAVGAIGIGVAVSAGDRTLPTPDMATGVVFVGVAGLVLQRDPREGLLLAAGAFVIHALFNLAHRPGWLPVDLLPHWYVVGCATYDVVIAGLCFWARRR
jgi:hypothetical protein